MTVLAENSHEIDRKIPYKINPAVVGVKAVEGLSFSTFASQRHAVPLPAISSVHFKSNSSQHSQEKIAGYNGNTYTFRLNSLSFVPNIQIFILLYISLKNS